MPDHILIIGAGEFGLSTALALLRRTDAQITILDRSPILPNPSGSSVDSSRIIRPDYAFKPYSALAAEAQVLWRDRSDSGWGGQGRYTEAGFVLTGHEGELKYVDESLENVRSLAKAGMPIDIDKIEELHSKSAIQRATKYDGVSGDSGYANWNSGWANAEKVTQFAIDKVHREGQGRAKVQSDSKVEQLIIEDGICKGALVNGQRITADLTIVAAGAWSPSLIDLQGRCVATGQALSYINITPEEQENMRNRPVVMNLSNGMFMMPPVDCQLKIARHGYGHVRLQVVRHPDGRSREVSVPQVGVAIPDEAQEVCRTFLTELAPSMADRPFTKTRLCWYCDT